VSEALVSINSEKVLDEVEELPDAPELAPELVPPPVVLSDKLEIVTLSGVCPLAEDVKLPIKVAGIPLRAAEVVAEKLPSVALMVRL